MRTTVIPAQITTVEDKIAGNLNFTQILLLIASLFIDTFIYAALPERLHFTLYKVPLMAVATFICLILCMRIKGRVMLSWIFLLSSYYFRPRYYLFNKNDLFAREEIIFVLETKKHTRTKALNLKKAKHKNLSFADFIKMQAAPANLHSRLSFKFDRKGGFDATVSKIES
ncbi:hypothetical protein KKE78_02540 [Patescibacteria group bacterium]|nr:hypothetical protein [Patescibacteria group bacterium]